MKFYKEANNRFPGSVDAANCNYYYARLRSSKREGGGRVRKGETRYTRGEREIERERL